MHCPSASSSSIHSFVHSYSCIFALCYGTVILSVCLSVCMSVCSVGIVANGWIDQDASWYGARLQPRPHCVKWGLGTHPPNGHSCRYLK